MDDIVLAFAVPIAARLSSSAAVTGRYERHLRIRDDCPVPTRSLSGDGRSPAAWDDS